MGGRRWTQEELQMVEEMSSSYTVEMIAKKLGRSFDAVNLKMNELGIPGFRRSTDMLTVNQVSIMFNVQNRTIVTKWKKKGLFIRRHGYYRMIQQESLIKYLQEHPEDWNAADVTDDSLIMSYPWYKEKRRQDVKSRYFWTTSEVAKMKHLRRQGYSLREIAEKMGRSESSIKYKLYRKE